MISLLCPTRGRPEQFTAMVESAFEMADEPDQVEVIGRIDNCDPALVGYLGSAPLAKYVTLPRALLSACWNQCVSYARGEILMHCGDDIRFRTPGWDRRVVAAFEDYPDRIVFVHGDDGFQHERLGTHGFLHRRWVDAVGYFVPPMFSSDFNDTWLTEVADLIGRRVYLPDVLTEHMHPAAGKGEWDLTHQERLQRHAADRPQDLYNATRSEREWDAAKLRAVMA